MQIKRVLCACVALCLLLAALPAAAASGWQGAYAELVQRGIAEYNKLRHTEKGGLHYCVLDIDLDGTPELYMAVIQTGQIDSVMTEVAFTIRDNQVQPIQVDTGAPIFLARFRDGRNNISLLQKNATAERLVMIKNTANEGSYDYAQVFYRAYLESGKVLAMQGIGSAQRPENLKQQDKEDAAGRAFFDQKAADFLKDYTVLAEGIGVCYSLQNREQTDGPIAEDAQQTLANLSAWQPAGVGAASPGAPRPTQRPAPATTDDGWLNLY